MGKISHFEMGWNQQPVLGILPIFRDNALLFVLGAPAFSSTMNSAKASGHGRGARRVRGPTQWYWQILKVSILGIPDVYMYIYIYIQNG